MRIVCLKYDMEDMDIGGYIASKISTLNGESVRFFSRAALLWSDMNKRCGNPTVKNT